MALAAGTRLGAYEILALLGAGGMGEVYRARDTRLGRDVAVKVLPADSLDSPSARRHLHKEAEALIRLSHPHIATLHDLDSADGMDFIVMELVPGPMLKEEAGGEEAEVVKAVVDPWEWALGRDGIYCAANETILFEYSAKYVIHYLDFASGEVRELYRREGPFAHLSLAVSPEEEWIVYGELPAITSELMLVEGFR